MCNNAELEVFNLELSIGVHLPKKCIQACRSKGQKVKTFWPFDLNT